jgi:hypothetical protein
MNTKRLPSMSLLLLTTACGSPEPAGRDGEEPRTGGPAQQATGTVPSEGDALFSYLRAGEYRSFARESRVHRSAGPHGFVRTHVNPRLEASLTAGNQLHPVGAAAVKELYDRSQELTGWAVMVKVGAGDAAADWYWYEVLSTTDGSAPVASGRDEPLCSDCHGRAPGHVFVMTPLP